ncbi:DNA polymerase IV [Brevibacillus ruminantium]|uniref:DNA polymerase IV n=1 Tax=Brevibacillus ruminantium TaxID=2950604 RepID=A0ABY4WA61_9BACL|nr:DNA polymerase IV [Brevibacillus ruminantium]USG63922.1 DNA polymerase IV [Brevibacillus ruminantium]
MKKILHVDIDAFYASVEQLDRPEYRGKPVIVGGSSNRGVVSTCSYEARKFGVRSAMPVALAKKKCPHGIFLPPRFDRYVEKSKEIRRVFSAYTERYQTVGLDEAYLDMSHYENAMPAAREIKRRIRRETGLTCSVGLSYNMSLAKIASDLKKPDAFVVIRPEQALEVLRELPIGTLHGVGKKTQEFLVKKDIHTIEDFWRLSLDEAVQMLGKMGHALYFRARGEDDREIVTERAPKSSSRETTLSFDLYTRETIAPIAYSLLQEVQQDIRDEGVIPQTITLKIKYADFTIRSKQRKREYGATWDELLEDLLDAFDYSPGVRLVGVGFSNFASPDEERYEQLSLFSWNSFR